MDKEENSVKKRPIFQRVMAIILIAIYIVLLITFVVFIIMGSKYVIPMLFVLIVYPLIIYLLLWLRKVFSNQ